VTELPVRTKSAYGIEAVARYLLRRRPTVRSVKYAVAQACVAECSAIN